MEDKRGNDEVEYTRVLRTRRVKSHADRFDGPEYLSDFLCFSADSYLATRKSHLGVDIRLLFYINLTVLK